MKRGEVWWANLPDPHGRSPVVLLNHNAASSVRASVTVAPLTRTIYQIPVEVSLRPDDGVQPVLSHFRHEFPICSGRYEGDHSRRWLERPAHRAGFRIKRQRHLAIGPESFPVFAQDK